MILVILSRLPVYFEAKDLTAIMSRHTFSEGSRNAADTRYGERCLPGVLDEISSTDPHRLYAVVPHSTELERGFRDVSFKEIAHCANYLAHLLEKDIGRSADSDTVAYLGVPDLRNVVVFLAAVKCGYKV